MARFVVAHGAWSSGFVWKKMHPLMRAMGHDLRTPSYTGLGDRFHLANAEIDLEMHIRDMISMLFHEDLRDVILIGHSYGGIVATGVADRAADRLAALVYLDAYVPANGQSMFDVATPELRSRWLEGARSKGDGWRVPSNPIPPDTSQADIDWITPRRHDQPIKTMTQPLKLLNGETTLPRTYIYCTRTAPGDTFGPHARHAKSDSSWRYHEMDASHSPHVTAPEDLARLLDLIAAPPAQSRS